MYDVVIWTPVNAKSGFGHFYRMLGFYEQLLEEKVAVSYFSNNDYIELSSVKIIDTQTENIEKIIQFLQNYSVKIIIIDNYEVSLASLKTLNNFFTILYFDAKFKNPKIDAILNFNSFAVNKYPKKNPKTKYFLGLKYMFYRKEIMEIEDVIIKKDEVFISIGGSDVKYITYKLLPYLPNSMHYNIILGKGCSDKYYYQIVRKLQSLHLKYSLYQQPKNYFEILARSEFVIVSCSTTVYEVSYFSKPFICINVIRNQDILEKYLKLHGINTFSLENLEEIADSIRDRKFKVLEDEHICKKKQSSLLSYIKEVLDEK